MTTINDIQIAHEEAHGRWSGCNWPTHYGSLGLDLEGVSSSQAHQSAGRWQAIATDEVAGDEVTAVDRGTRTGRSHQEQPRARARTYLNQWVLARGGEERHHVPCQGL